MYPAQVLGWLGIGVGVLLAFVVARKSSGGFWLTMVLLLFADLFLGLLLMGAVLGIYFVCLKIGVCPDTDDRSVWSFAYPLIATPAYLLSTIVGMLMRPPTTADGPREDAS